MRQLVRLWREDPLDDEHRVSDVLPREELEDRRQGVLQRDQQAHGQLATKCYTGWGWWSGSWVGLT